MKGQLECIVDAIERQPVADQQMQRKNAAEDQIRGLFLQVDGGAVRTDQHALSDADAGAGQADTLRRRRLRKKQDFRSGTRTFDCLFDQAGSGSRHDDRVRAASIRHLQGCVPQIFIPGMQSAGGA